MFIPTDDYYYEDTSSGGTYSKTPSGELDVDRFTNGVEECFYQTTSSLAHKKPKKIIINDCCNMISSGRFDTYFDSLLLQGFEVYQINQDELVKITKSDDVKARYLPVLNKKNRDKLLNHYRLEQDKVMIVDSDRLQKELKVEIENPSLKDVKKSTSSQEELILALKQYPIVVSNSDIDEINQLPVGEINITKSQPEDMRFILDSNKLSEKVTTLDALGRLAKGRMELLYCNIFDQFPNLKNLDVDEEFFLGNTDTKSNTLLNLNCLEISTGDRLGDCFTRLKEATQLESLTIWNKCQNFETIPSLQLPKLKHLTLNKYVPVALINKTLIDNQSIISLSILRDPKLSDPLNMDVFATNNKLETLYLQGGTLVSGSKNYSLNVTELTIINCKISAEELTKLLKQTPHLKSLKLVGVTVDGTMDEIGLPQLKNLELQGSSNKSVTRCLLNANQNLQNIVLKETPIPEDLKKQFSLVSIDITNWILNTDSIEPLLSPDLIDMKLNIAELQVTKGDYHLPALKQCQVKTKMSWDSFVNLIQFANLPDLNLSGISIKNLPDDVFLKIKQTLKFDRLHLDRKWYEALGNDLGSFLSIVPNLKRLYYGDSFDLGWIDPAFYKKIPYSQLTHLEILATSLLTSQEVDEFIEHLKKAKSLENILVNKLIITSRKSEQNVHFAYEYTRDLCELKFEHDLSERIIEQLSEMPSRRSKVSLEELYERSEDFTFKTQFSFHDLRIYKSYLTFNNFCLLLDRIKRSHNPENDIEIQNLSVGETFNLSVLNGELTISGEIKAEELEAVLKKIPNITSIVFNNVKLAGTLSVLELQAVQSINLRFTRLDSTNFSILQQSCNANANITFERGWELTGSNNIQEFRSLNVKDAKNISSDTYLVMKKAKIEELTIKSSDSSFLTEKEPLDSIIRLNAENINVSVNPLLAALPNLKHLSIDQTIKIKSYPELHKLETLSVTNTTSKDQSYKYLNGFLKNSTSLKVLEIKDLIIEGTLDKVKHSELRKVRLARSYISFENLKTIVETAHPKCQFDLEYTIILGASQSEINDYFIKHPNITAKHAPTKDKNKDSKKITLPKGADPAFKIKNKIDKDLDTPNIGDTWSQSMLNNKLARYCELKKLKGWQQFNKEIKEGTCSAISQWYADTMTKHDQHRWDLNHQFIREWDGVTLPEKNSATERVFNEFLSYVLKYQLGTSVAPKVTRPVNDLGLFLKDAENKSPIFLTNAWHKTVLVFKNNQWHFYDPNYVKGTAKIFSKDETDALIKEVNGLIGHGLHAQSYHLKTLPNGWSEEPEHINAFVRDGGLEELISSHNFEILDKLEPKALSRPALDTIYSSINLSDLPSWAGWIYNLQKLGKTAEIQKLVDCLHQCHEVYGKSFEETLKKQVPTITRDVLESLLSSLDKLNNKTDTSRYLIKLLSEIKNPKLPPPKVDFKAWLKDPSLKQVDISQPELMIKSDKINESSVLKLKTPTQAIVNNKYVLKLALSQTQQPSLPKNSRFKTWLPKTLDGIQSITEFDYKLFKHEGENVLLEMTSDEQVLDYIHHLQSNTLVQNQGLFVINTPEALKCATNWIKLDEQGHGVISKGSPLSEFLLNHKDKKPLIVVNWSNFTPQQLVQANTIIDAVRKADGTDVPQKAIVLGIRNKEAPNVYQGSDFSSRHGNNIYDFPTGLVIPKKDLPDEVSKDSKATEVVIDFFDETSWQTYLYGRWNLKENALEYEHSPFLNALEKTDSSDLKLTLKNAPWHDASFSFAMNTMINQRYINHLGKRYELPKNITIDKAQGYELKSLVGKNLTVSTGFTDTYDYILNPDSLSSFFTNYKNENKKLTSLPGLLEQHQGTEDKPKALTLYITRELSLHSLAKLLTKANEMHCHLHFNLAPGVELPKELSALVTVNKNDVKEIKKPWAELIQSDDLAYTQHDLANDHKFDAIVDMSELKRSDLFIGMNGTQKENHFEFNEVTSPILEGLRKGQHILLKGALSPELADALAPLLTAKGELLFNGKTETLKGKLVILTDYKAPLSFVSKKTQKHPGIEDKLKALPRERSNFLMTHYTKEQLASYSYSYLNALSQAEPFQNPKDLMGPLYQLPDMIPVETDFNLDEKKSLEFKEERKNLLLHALKKGPTVFLSGKTGVGKSSFMHELAKLDGVKVHFDDIEQWAKTSDGKTQNILFIDEANLQNTDYSMFEGLYSNPRSIFYKGAYHLLKPTDSVIFAGNPANYGGERIMPKLFIEHPNVVTFGPMTNAYLYHEVLKHILTGMEENEAKKVATVFIKTFRHVEALDPTSISARELQMMAFKFMAKSVPKEPMARAIQSAYEMAEHLVSPEKHDAFKSWFKTSFGEPTHETPTPPKEIGAERGGFLLTKTHQPIYLNIKELLDIRALKEKNTGKASYGGLSSLVLEGEPGGGKSYLVQQILLSESFEKSAPATSFDYVTEKDNIKPQKKFYYLPASLSVSSKIATLNKAFHEGAVVIGDELNTSVALERLVNALQMGEDLQGRRAVRPGFTLIGTQNPETMAGRRKAGLASRRRVMLCQYNDYTPDEMVDVLVHLKCRPDEACNLVYDYLSAKQYAEKNNKEPIPSFRDLIHNAKENIQAHEKSTSEESKSILREQTTLPYIEKTLTDILVLTNPEHQAYFEKIKKIGFDKLFYCNKEGVIYFQKNVMVKGCHTKLDKNNAETLVKALPEMLEKLEKPAATISEIKDTLYKYKSSVQWYYDAPAQKKESTLSGSQLKAAILEQFRSALNQAVYESQSIEELNKNIDKIKDELHEELTILKTQQSKIMTLLKPKTSSISALEAMCDEARKIFSEDKKLGS